jgi:hypothetical protein
MIDKICNDGIVESIIKNLGVSPKYVDDLTQEIYLILLEYDRDKITEMYNNKQLNFFLTRVIKNQINSVTSPFYKKYRKYYEYADENKNNYMNMDNDDDECTEDD